MMPLTGWLAGQFGVKYTFLASVVGFTIASALVHDVILLLIRDGITQLSQAAGDGDGERDFSLFPIIAAAY